MSAELQAAHSDTSSSSRKRTDPKTQHLSNAMMRREERDSMNSSKRVSSSGYKDDVRPSNHPRNSDFDEIFD